jgi:hypothetical protein
MQRTRTRAIFLGDRALEIDAEKVAQRVGASYMNIRPTST